MVSSLDDLEEEGGTIFDRLGEDLKKVTLLVVVDQDLVLLQDVDIFFHLKASFRDTFSQLIIVGVRNLVKEFNTACLHAFNSLHNIFGAHSNVLNACAAIILAVLLNLGLADSVCGLIDGHLDFLVKIGHNDRSEGRVRGVDHFVVDGPEAVEVQHLLVPLRHGLHLAIVLVANAMVDVLQVRLRKHSVQHFGAVVNLEAGEEGASVVDSLHESVDSVSVGFDGGSNDFTVFVLESFGLLHGHCTSLYSLVVDASCVVNSKGNILDAIAVFRVVRRKFRVRILRVKRRGEGKADFAILDHMGHKVTISCLKALK